MTPHNRKVLLIWTLLLVSGFCFGGFAGVGVVTLGLAILTMLP